MPWVNPARDWLIDYLAGKGPMLSADIYAAAEKDGISRHQLARARTDLGVQYSVTSTFPMRTMWELIV